MDWTAQVDENTQCPKLQYLIIIIKVPSVHGSTHTHMLVSDVGHYNCKQYGPKSQPTSNDLHQHKHTSTLIKYEITCVQQVTKPKKEAYQFLLCVCNCQHLCFVAHVKWPKIKKERNGFWCVSRNISTWCILFHISYLVSIQICTRTEKDTLFQRHFTWKRSLNSLNFEIQSSFVWNSHKITLYTASKKKCDIYFNHRIFVFLMISKKVTFLSLISIHVSICTMSHTGAHTHTSMHRYHTHTKL